MKFPLCAAESPSEAVTQLLHEFAIVRDTSLMPLTHDDPAETIAARVRAALAYAALTYEDAADLIPGLGAATLRRIASPKNPRGATFHELGHIARACDVPPDWFASGRWTDSGEPPPSPYPDLGVGTRERRLAVVEHYLGVLLEIEHARTGGPFPAPPPDEVERVRRGRRPRQLASGS
jgi:hypothetical protein